VTSSVLFVVAKSKPEPFCPVFETPAAPIRRLSRLFWRVSEEEFSEGGHRALGGHHALVVDR
jgi:hypothetical protein